VKISEFSVKNSLVVNCLSLFIVIAGIFALRGIEREAFPNFSFDIITVQTTYPGASPEVIEKRITIPLEKELKEVDNIDEMGSISVEGFSLIALKLDPDARNTSQIFIDVQKAVEDAQDLPDDLEEKPKVKEIETRDTPIVEVSLSGSLSEKEIRDLALRLETELLDMKEVSAVVRKGIRDREIWVEIDPKKMQSMEIALPQVFTALAERNVNVPGGLFKEKGEEWIIRTSGELNDARDVESVVIRANEEGNWVQVNDVARVTDRFEEMSRLQRTNGSRSQNLLVVKKDRADAIRLVDEVKDLIEKFQAKGPPELKVHLINDLSYYIKRRLNVLVNNAWLGFILVLIPIVLFLSPRVALAAAMGMPVAILTAIIGMNLLGISINLLSMFGLIMVLGMLVDEDLVISENIARYLEQGYPHEEAAIRGASEVQGALISVVLTTVIAFFPLLFMTGIFGKFVSEIPKVVMITLSASLFEALVILPSHLSEFNKPHKEGVKTLYKKGRQHRAYEKVRNLYEKTLSGCLRHPYLTTAFSLLLTAAVILYGVFNIRFILFPSKGIEAFFVRARAPLGTSLEGTEKLIEPLEKLVASLPKNELENQVTMIGIQQNDPNDPFTVRGTHLDQIAVFLSPKTDRHRDADAIMEALRPHASEIHGLEEIVFEPVRPGAPVGKPVAVRIRGEDFTQLKNIAAEFKRALGEIQGVQDIQDDFEPGKGELRVVVDEKTARQAQLSYQTIARTVRFAFEGIAATTIRKTDDEIDVVVRLPEELRSDLKAVESLLIYNQAGHLVPLSKVARIERVPGLSVIKHFNSKRVVTVTANVDERITSSQIVNRALQRKMEDFTSQHPDYFIDYGGEYEETAESMQSLFRAFLLALLLIFFVLLVTFGSVLQTLVLLLTIPFGAVGIVLGFGLAGEPLSFLAMLGMVGLTGVVVDGGTLQFTFINERRRQGVHLFDAIVEGCSTRLRSIFLTTVTTVFGVIPAAYGLGGSDPFIRPMALALNWGIGISVIFTLFAIPCFYYLVEHWRALLKHKLKWKATLTE